MRSSILILISVLSLTLAFKSARFESLLETGAPLTDDQTLDLYNEWLVYYEKPLTNLQETMGSRFSIFKEEVESIVKHNADDSQSWKKGLNAFSDMTFDEFKTYYNIKDGIDCPTSNNPLPLKLQAPIASLPKEVDWRTKNVVTPVRDQGSCGSCWSFAAAGCIESHYAIENGKQVILAEQQLVDCARDFVTFGCGGGLPSHAYTYTYYHGIMLETDYPYQAKEGVCKFDDKKAAVSVLGSFNITELDEPAM